MRPWKYEELCEKAKDTLRRDLRCSSYYPHDDWAECTIDDWKEKLESAEYGFTDVKIYFTGGFCCQGDGACFTAGSCNKIDLTLPPDLMEELKASSLITWADHAINGEVKCDYEQLIENWQPEITNSCVDHSGRFYHENSMDADFEWDFKCDHILPPDDLQREITNHCDTVKEAFKDKCHDLAQEIYRDIEQDYEWHMADDQLDDHIIANDGDALYTEDGDEWEDDMWRENEPNDEDYHLVPFEFRDEYKGHPELELIAA